MAFKKIHRRADLDVHKRQLLGTSTSSHAATTSSSAAYQGDLPPGGGPPLYVSTGTSTASTSRTTSGTSTSSSSQTTSTSTTAVVAPQTQVQAQTSARVTSAAAEVPASRSTVTRVVSTTSSSSASATTTSTGSDGMSVGSIAGIAAAAIIAIGVASIFVVWLMRRKRKNNDIDEVPFNRNSYLQHSTTIPDDDPLPSRTRPNPGPDMVERQPTYGGGTPTFSDMGHNSFGYHTQPSYQPGQMYGASSFGPGGAPATPLPHTPGYGAPYDQQGYNAGGYTELTRGGPHDYPPSPRHDQYPPSPSYAGDFPGPPAERDVVNHKQVNYPELSPAPTMAQQGHVVTANSSVHDGRETPVQLGFVPAQPRQPAPAAGQPHGKSGRPETLYDHEDAYGGM